MSYSYSFVPNDTYGAKEINDITKRLVTSGVEDIFEDGVAYNESHLNTISSTLATSGVIPENNTSLKVSDNGKTNNEYTITISDGTAFFENGSTITLYNGGETLPYTHGKKNYVYVHRDLNLNKNMPKVTLTEPEGDFVPLAEISEDGTITDTRTFAKGKLPGYQSDYDNSKSIISEGVSDEVEIDIGGRNYGMILINVYPHNDKSIRGIPSSTTLMVNGELQYNICNDGGSIKTSNDINHLCISYYTSTPVEGSLVFENDVLKIKLNTHGFERIFDIITYFA